MEARRNDGANQYGEEKGSQGRAYFDYTGYQPVNTADETMISIVGNQNIFPMAMVVGMLQVA